MSFKWNGNKILSVLEKNIVSTLNQAGDQYVREIQQSFPAGSWRKWRSKRSKKMGGISYHWSSEIGQPPAVDTANLKDNIFYRVKRHPNLIRLQIGVSLKKVPYARALEFGLRHKMLAPRPWLMPAYQRITKSINGYLARGIRTGKI